ncbi:polysaccharide pyruvyl transferase family protein [Bradyrhizobium sp. 157]|uniref:polysaccharide pyruvyl transferase family protein n=1 Tax=Bradyrhizobium sp. 157 TaxID=2782631 RepID=UPI00201BC63D|nr:polysaccharide pyruvyl transferase family protein [Bradyrhizobium sp. 157]
MKVVTFNVKYSPNLGDGVIADCLETELARRLPDIRIEALDLSGRINRDSSARSGSRVLALKTLQKMPAILRDVLVEGLLRLHMRRKCRPVWREALRDADLAIVGGGQLIQDGDLNFPVKLSIVASECRRNNVPIALFGLGVAESRSRRGAALISSLLHSDELVFAGARDGESASRLRRRRVNGVVVTPDPGLLASRLWPLSGRGPRKRPVVGVGITHPVVLQHHGERQPDDTTIRDLYQSLIRRLLASGYDVTGFSNGAPEDRAYLDDVVGSMMSNADERLTRAPDCKTPRELAELVGSFDAVIAHRLHACILAYSYRVVHVGLSWDPKLAAFFANVGRSRYLVDFNDDVVRAMPELLAAARVQKISAVQHERVLALSSASIDRLVLLLKGETRPKLIESSETESALQAMQLARFAHDH